MQTEELVARQRAFFGTGATGSVSFRRHALESLHRAIRQREDAIAAALAEDLRKSPYESYLCETGIVLSELSWMEKHLAALARVRPVKTPLAQFGSKSFVIPEPCGVALILSPWNYPFMLALDPLAGALAAGCCAVIKPSASAPASARVIRELIASVFPDKYVAVVEGGHAENETLLEQRFDHIFFTGSARVGRLVMEKAARRLTPVTLELGGKSPCIVDGTADLGLTAKRLVFGKFLNAGQTCVAPDYVLVHAGVRDALLDRLRAEIEAVFGADPFACPDYGRIVNEKHYRRLLGLLADGRAVCGGTGRESTLQIAPTVLTDVEPDSPVMREEIFGPILPVLTWETLDEAVAFVNARPKPLALYLFTRDPDARRRVLRSCSFGGGCVNDTVVHLATSEMPFGGVGESGLGRYHGRDSFDTFTHYKSVMCGPEHLDLPMRYRPYTKKKLALVKQFLK